MMRMSSAFNKNIGRDIDVWIEKIPVGLREAMYTGGRRIVNSIDREYRDGVKTGRIYRRGGREHIASAEGETPARITGDYGRSLDFLVTERFMEVGAGVEYAEYLENQPLNRIGLENGIRKEARRLETDLGEAMQNA